MTTRAVIKGVGHYLPDRIVPNSEFAATLETSDAWIRSRSGIERRHFAAKGQGTSDLASRAATAALLHLRGQPLAQCLPTSTTMTYSYNGKPTPLQFLQIKLTHNEVNLRLCKRYDTKLRGIQPVAN